MKNLRLFVFFIIFLSIFTLSSCSLIYQIENIDEEASEIILYDLIMTKVTNGKKENIIKAKQMEQYRKNEEMYAHDVFFSFFDKNEILETEGWTANLKSEKDEVLIFFGGVDITSYKEDAHLEAKNLRVDTKLEQLTSDTDDSILIQYGLNDEKATKLYIQANNLAASGVSNTIRISGGVSGLIIVEENNENAAQSGEIE